MGLIDWVKHRLRQWLLADADAAFAVGIRQMTGLEPRRIDLYHLATRHASLVGLPGKSSQESNERLEFLGDAVLGLVVAERLYVAFPDRQEGFLTELRSKIVNGESLGRLAQQIGLADLIRYEGRRKTQMTHRSMHGDALEALVGAVYLDYGYEPCRRFILDRLINPHYDLEALSQEESNPKSGILHWAQQNAIHLRFEITHAEGKSHQRTFTATVMLNGLSIVAGQGYSKKKAEQTAAALALEMIQRGALPPLPRRPERTAPTAPQTVDRLQSSDESGQLEEAKTAVEADDGFVDEAHQAFELEGADESAYEGAHELSQAPDDASQPDDTEEVATGLTVTTVTTYTSVTTISTSPSQEEGSNGQDPEMAGLIDDAYAWLLAQESPTGLTMTMPIDQMPSQAEEDDEGHPPNTYPSPEDSSTETRYAHD